VSKGVKDGVVSFRKTRHVIAAGAAASLLFASAPAALSADCKPDHLRAPFVVKTMGRCAFDVAAMAFQGTPAEQARCLMRGMDQSRNLAPPIENFPAALAERVGTETGLPTREALSTFLSRLDLEWDFAAYLWQPLSHANNNDADAPTARYFVIHDTSGPSYGHHDFPEDLDSNSRINNLAGFKCDDGWGKAHVVISRTGGMLLNHELATPWRETKFELAANFSGALKGLFLHVEMIQPRRAAPGRGRHNDAQSPDPPFTGAQYDRLALLYTIASVRAGQWLIPAFHAALDADIPNGHDDPLNFNITNLATSLDEVVKKLLPVAAVAQQDRATESAQDAVSPAPAASETTPQPAGSAASASAAAPAPATSSTAAMAQEDKPAESAQDVVAPAPAASEAPLQPADSSATASATAPAPATPSTAAMAQEDKPPESAQDTVAPAPAAPETTPQPAESPAATPPPTPPAPAPTTSTTAVMTAPHITSFAVDWTAARAAVPSADQAPRAESAGTPADALTSLNQATAHVLSTVAASAVPVLLPFDAAAFLRERAQGTGGDDGKYFSEFHAPSFFYSGPTGYDAAFSARADDLHDLDLVFARTAEVQLSASTIVYDLDGPAPDLGAPVPALEHDFPGLRRVIAENRVRYIFTRFGVPYFVSIACNDGPKSARLLACREADLIAVRFLKTLNLVGGAPREEPAKTEAAAIEEPADASPDFAYYAPGDILPGTGMNGKGGKFDTTVYARIRFPMAHAPAYINSQSFMHWGNCDLTGRVALGGHGKDESYRCRVNDIPLFKDESKNYVYPWRDNFCEHRYYEVAQCPVGLGHQGEDIRPSTCKLRNEDADRCEPYQDDVVAARDGVVWRSAGDEALYLIADAPTERVRLRYLHMTPRMLDAAGMVSGHMLAEGDVIGPVGDYGRREGGTTYHLHFDVQVLTCQGWLFVNPYMTLVAAYERLIGARGRVIVAQAPHAAPDAMIAAAGINPERVPAKNAALSESKGGDSKGSETKGEDKHRERAVEHCQTRFVKGHRRRVCWTDAADNGERANPSRGVRTVDRGVSR
jgi:hypothetical protein